MSQLNTETSVTPPLSPRLRERAAALGVTVVWLEPTGRAAPVGASRWIEGQVIAAAPFAAAVQSRWAELSEAGGKIVEIWPGVWLAPLPAPRRRRLVTEKFRANVVAALMLGAEFLDSEQFRLVCSSARLDAAAAAARVEPAGIVTRAEAQRLAQSLSWMQADSLEIDRRSTELHKVSSQLGESYEELSLLYKLSTSMAVNQPPQQFLTESCRELQQVLGLKWMGLLLVDDEPRLQSLAGQMFTAGPIGCDEAMLKRIGKQVLQKVADAGAKSMIVDDTQTLGVPNLPRIASQLLIVPMLRDNRPHGLVFGGEKLDGSQLSSVDSKLCASLANSLSIFLENMMLYEDMHAMFLGTLHALTASIDAKDSYTRGHSERVAMMSRRLAIAAGVDAEQVERVYIAGLVHDVGKIGVPEAVLTKPGQLTDDEFALIKLHPEIGANILRDIRQMQDLVPGVLYHHERWDGRGYPHKLAGERIPLFGRLICLADSFDAMSSNRTYRQALRLEQVLSEIRRCAGAQFDPELARLFVQLDFTEFFQMIERHQAQAKAAGGIAA